MNMSVLLIGISAVLYVVIGMAVTVGVYYSPVDTSYRHHWVALTAWPGVLGAIIAFVITFRSLKQMDEIMLRI